MQLPTTQTPPSTVDPKVLILYGSPKVGKTSVLAQLPNCLIVDCEQGTDFLSALRVQVNSVPELRELASALHAPNAHRYDYIAIDTISAMEDWAEGLATEKYKASPTGKNFTGDSVLTLPNGGGYLWLRLAFQEMLGLFSGTTKRLILIAHLREKELTDKKGVGTTVKDLELTGKIRSIVASKADAVGYLFRSKTENDGQLMISFMTLEEVLCGSRCEHLKGKSFPFDWSKIFTTDKQLQKTT